MTKLPHCRPLLHDPGFQFHELLQQRGEQIRLRDATREGFAKTAGVLELISAAPGSALAERRPPLPFVLFSFRVRPVNRLGAHGEPAAVDKFLVFKEVALPPILPVASQLAGEASSVLGEGPLPFAVR